MLVHKKEIHTQLLHTAYFLRMFLKTPPKSQIKLKERRTQCQVWDRLPRMILDALDETSHWLEKGIDNFKHKPKSESPAKRQTRLFG